MQDRKRLQESIQQDSTIAGTTSDLETLFELSREGEDVGAELERELKAFRRQLDEARNGHAAIGRERSAAARS